MTSSSSRRPSGAPSSGQPRAKRAGRPASPAHRTGEAKPGRAKPSQAGPGQHAQRQAAHLAPDSLGFALDQAAQAVGAVRAGSALPAALSSAFAGLAHDVVATSRGAVQDIAYRTMRRLGTVDWLIKQRVSKAPPPQVLNLLACALAQVGS